MEQQITQEIGWLIEYNDTGRPATWMWSDKPESMSLTGNAYQALRFARKEDAEMLLKYLNYNHYYYTVTEHIFYGESPEPPQTTGGLNGLEGVTDRKDNE